MNRPETRAAHVVVPASVDDPLHPSGGNVYDREVVAALRAGGTPVHVHLVTDDLGAALAVLPDGAPVVVDGLLGLAHPEALDPRVVVVLLVHLPLSLGWPDDGLVARHEQEALERAAGVITTSGWTRDWLVSRGLAGHERITVARPGAHPEPPAHPSPDGHRLLCVGAVLPAKGQDLLVQTLGRLDDLDWTCVLLGPTDRDPGFATSVRRTVDEAGLSERVHLAGPMPRRDVAAAYAAADLLVAPTRLETYGMTVTEALAHAVPVVATDVGGVAEALGDTDTGRPGVLVPLGDAMALADVLRDWLTDPQHRERLRHAAAVRRTSLTGWDHTAEQVRTAVRDAVNRSGSPAVEPP